MKVRIGNDICLYVNLLGNHNFEAVNVNSINAYLINTSKWLDIMDEAYRESALMQDEIECRKDKIKFVSRFPVEPHFPGFHPTPYDVCCTGHPCYHQHPIPYIPMYHGYGVHPHTFERGCYGPCAWHTNHPHHLHEPHTWRHDDMHDIIDRAGIKYMDMQHQYDRCRFLAPVEATDVKNKIKVYFPAQAQLYTGVYKLVLVAKLYEPGYCKDNLRTVTIDYEDVFTLVGRCSDGCEGAVTIYVNTKKLYSGDLVSVTSPNDYYIQENETLRIGSRDAKGNIYKLILNLIGGKEIEYQPEDWEMGSITFESSDPGIVHVNEHFGTLTAMPNSNGKYAIISVYNSDHTLMTQYTVTVGEGGITPTPTTTWTVTFDSNGGSVVPSLNVVDGNYAQLPSNPTKTDNDFTGWYLGNNIYQFNTPVKGNITLTAHWTPRQVTPTTPTPVSMYISGQDQVISGNSITLRAVVTLSDGTTSTNYSGVQWSVDNTNAATINNSGILVGKTVTSNTNVVVTANLSGISPATKTVTVRPDNEIPGAIGMLSFSISGADDLVEGTGSQYSIINISPSDATDTSVSWSVEGGGTITQTGYYTAPSTAPASGYVVIKATHINSTVGTVTKQKIVTISPQTQLPTFRVTFNPNNGQNTFYQEKKQGEKLVKPTDPTKSGYTFNGWHVDSLSGSVWNFNNGVTSTMYLIAGWTENITPVTHDYKVQLNKTSMSLEVGDTDTLTATCKDGNATVTSGNTISWTSSAPTIVSVNKGNVTALREGGPVTITATWVEQSKSATCIVTATGGSTPEPTPQVTVTYHLYPENGTYTGTITLTIDKGTKPTPIADPQRNYYEFKWWSKNSSGTQSRYLFNENLQSDLDLYAVWELTTEYAVICEAYGGLNGNGTRYVTAEVGDRIWIDAVVKENTAGYMGDYTGSRLTFSTPSIDSNNVSYVSQDIQDNYYRYRFYFDCDSVGTNTEITIETTIGGTRYYDSAWVSVVEPDALPEYRIEISDDDNTSVYDKYGSSREIDLTNHSTGDIITLYALQNDAWPETVHWTTNGALGAEFVHDDNDTRAIQIRLTGRGHDGDTVNYVQVTCTGWVSEESDYCTLICPVDQEPTPDYNFSITPTTMSLTVGEGTGTIIPMVDGSTSFDGNVQWQVSGGNENCVTVNNGVVTPVEQGETTVTAVWYGHPDGSPRQMLCHITVSAAQGTAYADGVTITSDGQESITLRPGLNAPIEAHKLRGSTIDDSLAGELTFEITNPGILRFAAESGDGISYDYGYHNTITALTTGTTLVKVTLRVPDGNTYHEYTDTLTVTIVGNQSDYDENLSISASSNEIHVGDTVTFTINSDFASAYNYAKDKYGDVFDDPYYTLDVVGNNTGILSSNTGDVANGRSTVAWFKGSGQYGLADVPNELTFTVTATGLGDIRLTFTPHYGPYGLAGEDGTPASITVSVTPNAPTGIDLQLDKVIIDGSETYPYSGTPDYTSTGYEYYKNYLKTDIIHCPANGGYVTLNATITPPEASQAITWSTDYSGCFVANTDGHGMSTSSEGRVVFTGTPGTLVTVTAASTEAPSINGSILIYFAADADDMYLDYDSQGLAISIDPENQYVQLNKNFDITVTDTSNGAELEDIEPINLLSNITLVDTTTTSSSPLTKTFTFKKTSSIAGLDMIWFQGTFRTGKVRDYARID